jgi:hypothetical protein
MAKVVLHQSDADVARSIVVGRWWHRAGERCGEADNGQQRKSHHGA